MNTRITVFIPADNPEYLKLTLAEFHAAGLENHIYLLINQELPLPELPQGVSAISITSLFSSETIRKIALHSKTDYLLWYTSTLPLKLGAYSIKRMLRVAEDTFAGLTYSDYFALKENRFMPNPVIEYQDGSLRDDFNFGSLLLFETAAFLETASRMKESYRFAGLYDLRLKLSQKYTVFRIAEFLYTQIEQDVRKSGEKLFDYVKPGNRDAQIEMEQACTQHLKETGAWLSPVFREVRFNETHFKTEISVIIPVRNRVRTIGDAMASVLMQQTGFPSNLIIVDNHSSDGTTELIKSYAKKDQRIIHLIPSRSDLGIGGCWNEAIFHTQCGKFAVQLDSDDLYMNNNVLSQIAEAFHNQQCAMLVGSYRMVNFKLEEISPGVIDHREWTPENGRNNALRINGLGAPRAFYTPVIRSIGFPNVSYGEDYAVGLEISRYYQIGRIYEPLYLCRRWEENSDASLDVNKMNQHNFYKDKIRTIEFKARQQYIQEGQLV
jgi:GT2 family glycosyltransferase